MDWLNFLIRYVHVSLWPSAWNSECSVFTQVICYCTRNPLSFRLRRVNQRHPRYATPSPKLSGCIRDRFIYEDVSKSFRTGRLEQELQMVQLSATRCSCIAILWGSLVRFAVITLCVAYQRVFIFVVVYFVIESVRKILDTPSYIGHPFNTSHSILNVN
jgi:hypothetical protein